MAAIISGRNAMGLTLVVATMLCGAARAAKQSDLSLFNPPYSRVAREIAVGDQVPPSVRLDDDGYPDRPYGILIVDGTVVVIVDRITRLVVEVIR
jgi:hypothetical protein